MNKHTAPLSTTFAALADPTRRAILLQLSQGESSVSALAEPFQMSLPALTKHLYVLERAGLVKKGRDAQRRPCRINAEPLKHATEWMAQYRQLWEERLDRLDAFLQQLQVADNAQTLTEQTQTPSAPQSAIQSPSRSKKAASTSTPSSKRKAP